jgi:hypothetical protein
MKNSTKRLKNQQSNYAEISSEKNGKEERVSLYEDDRVSVFIFQVFKFNGKRDKRRLVASRADER